ncbi:MAG: hypothetical protein WCU88_01645 [Elusimicrobiota bacterium]
MKRLCVHLHFDAPACENPWLGLPEPDPEPGGPWRDACGRCFDRVVKPYLKNTGILSHSSLSFSTELLDWMKTQEPKAYRLILDCDRKNRNVCAALQPPLDAASSRPPAVRMALDWSLADFRGRFGRPAEGISLPQGHAPDPVLELLAAAGLRWVLLRPGLAARTRPCTKESVWADADPLILKTRRPYLHRTLSGPITLFFIDAPLSEAASSGKLAALDGPALALELAGAFRGAGMETLVLAADAQAFSKALRSGKLPLEGAFAELLRDGSFRPCTPSRLLSELPPPPEEISFTACPPAPPAPENALRALSEDLDLSAQALLAKELPDPDAAFRAHLCGHALPNAPEPLSPAALRKVLRLFEVRRRSLELLDSRPEARDQSLRRAALALSLLKKESGDEGPRERFLAALGGMARSFLSMEQGFAVDADRVADHAAAFDHLAHSMTALKGEAGTGVFITSIDELERSRRPFHAGNKTLSVLRVRVFHRRFCEETLRLCAVQHLEDAEFSLWSRSGWSPKDASDAEALRKAFEDDDAGLPALAQEIIGPRKGLDALFVPERRRAVAALCGRPSLTGTLPL